MQLFGTQPAFLSASQQAVIIPHHPLYIGGALPRNDTCDPVQCSIYSNLDSSNPNWLPGLPRPPPGVRVEPPRNRSKRERWRYLSQLNRLYCYRKEGLISLLYPQLQQLTLASFRAHMEAELPHHGHFPGCVHWIFYQVYF